MARYPVHISRATEKLSVPAALRCGLVGAFHRTEFQLLRSTFPSETAWIEAPTIPKLIESWASSPPEFIVVCQSWSDEFTTDEITRLFATAPLARTVVVMGAWCAADGRTRTRWPVALRVPWWAAAQRIRGEIQGSWLTWTATREETVLVDYGDVRQTNLLNGLEVGIITADRSYADWLTRQVVDAGGSTAWYRSVNDLPASINTLVIDADPLEDSVISDIITGNKPRPVVAMIGEPTSDQCQRLRELGVAEVVSKLAPIPVLPTVLASAR